MKFEVILEISFGFYFSSALECSRRLCEILCLLKFQEQACFLLFWITLFERNTISTQHSSYSVSEFGYKSRLFKTKKRQQESIILYSLSIRLKIAVLIISAGCEWTTYS